MRGVRTVPSLQVGRAVSGLSPGPQSIQWDGRFSGPYPTPLLRPRLSWLWATYFLCLHWLHFKSDGGQLGPLT